MPTLSSSHSRPSPTTAFNPKRLLSRALMAAALLAGAGAALSAGSAQAATGCGVQITWAAWAGGQSLTCDDKEFTYLSHQTIGDLATSVVEADQPLPGDYLFNLDFPAFTTVPFAFTYQATITDPTRFFKEVDLDSDADALANPPSILTATYTFAGGNSPIVLTSTNGSSAVQGVEGHPTIMTVNNVYNGNGAIDTMENSYQQGTKVPGPVPILGAGMAFGFSRKLRRRIQGQRVTG